MYRDRGLAAFFVSVAGECVVVVYGGGFACLCSGELCFCVVSGQCGGRVVVSVAGERALVVYRDGCLCLCSRGMRRRGVRGQDFVSL